MRSEMCEPVAPPGIIDPGLGLFRSGNCSGTLMLLTAMAIMMMTKRKKTLRTG